MWVGCKVQKRKTDPSALELQSVMSHLTMDDVVLWGEQQTPLNHLSSHGEERKNPAACWKTGSTVNLAHSGTTRDSQLRGCSDQTGLRASLWAALIDWWRRAQPTVGSSGPWEVVLSLVRELAQPKSPSKQ